MKRVRGLALLLSVVMVLTTLDEAAVSVWAQPLDEEIVFDSAEEIVPDEEELLEETDPATWSQPSDVSSNEVSEEISDPAATQTPDSDEKPVENADPENEAPGEIEMGEDVPDRFDAPGDVTPGDPTKPENPYKPVVVTFYHSDKTTVLAKYELEYNGQPVSLEDGVLTDGTYLSSFRYLQFVHNGYGYYRWNDFEIDDPITSKVVYQQAMTRDYSYYLIYKDTPYEYTINYNMDGGEWTAAQEKNLKKTYTLNDDFAIEKPRKAGYLFDGWFLDAAFTQPIEKITAVNCFNDNLGNGALTLHLYAKFTAITPPAAPAILSAENIKTKSSGKAVITLQAATGCDGVELSFSTVKDFSKNENVVDLKKETTFTLTNVPKKKTYYFRARAYIRDSAGNLYSGGYGEVVSCYIKYGMKETSPTSSSGKITKIAIQDDGELLVTATISKRLKSYDESYYLVLVDPVTKKYQKKVATTYKSKEISFTLPIKDDEGTNLIQKKFALAVQKSKGKYTLISAGKFISNPEQAATYTAPFPTVASKKGAQGWSDKKINIDHVFQNMWMDEVLGGSIPYTYNGTTYKFNDPWGDMISAANAKGMVMTGQFTMRWYDAKKYMILKSARTAGASPTNLYALNAQEKKAREELEAAFCFLAERYSRPDCHLDNWILGNEVNIYSMWCYAGNISRETFMKNYVDTFRILYYAVKSSSANARVYICTDHVWTEWNGQWGARDFMTSFNTAIKKQNSKIQWNLAFHPYPGDLTNARVWNDNANPSFVCTSSADSHIVSTYNLDVLTKYVKKKFGEKTRIILSEVGYTVRTGTDVQAAALAYSYYKAEFNSMIDAFMLLFTNDAPNGGEDFSLTEGDGSKRAAYNVFRYMNTPKYKSYTDSCLKTIGVSSWKKVTSSFKESKLEEMPLN